MMFILNLVLTILVNFYKIIYKTINYFLKDSYGNIFILKLLIKFQRHLIE